MDKNPVLESGLRLVAVKEQDAFSLYQWFSDLKQISSWGGPGFDYPMTQEAFLGVLRVNELSSYWLEDNSGTRMGFGQFYNRLNRYHLGRLVISPEQRGKGMGKSLVLALLESAPDHIELEGNVREASLFVMRNNPAAFNCYTSLGFAETPYPGPIPGDLKDCAYMVKPMQ